jgi:hypothetical protein
VWACRFPLLKLFDADVTKPNWTEVQPWDILAANLWHSSAENGQESVEVRSRRRSSQFDLASLGIGVLLFQSVARFPVKSD